MSFIIRQNAECFLYHRYGLLGPSGCGKTSLLRCILNQLKPGSGSVSIFGSKPGSKGSSVPGPGVGYMPQEIALIPEFTILETVQFFGHLNGMSRESLNERSRFLLRFLDLPDGQQLIRELRYGHKDNDHQIDDDSCCLRCLLVAYTYRERKWTFFPLVTRSIISCSSFRRNHSLLFLSAVS